MKIPHIIIKWQEIAKVPVEVSVRKLSNGYLIGNVYFASEEMLVKNLAEWVKDPHANHDIPKYEDK